MKIVVAADHLVTPEVWKEHLVKRFPGEGLSLAVTVSDWPMQAFYHGPEVDEWLGSEDELVELIEDADAIVTQLAPLTRRVIEAGRNLKIIGCCRTGPVNVNVPAATQRGIPVIFGPGRNGPAVAEFTLGLILSELKNITRAHIDLKKGIWRGDFYRFDKSGPELSRMTVGLVGFGAIGRLIAPLLKPFGCRLLVYDPFVSAETVAEQGAEAVDLHTLLATSDLVSLHLRVTPETRKMFGRDLFAEMKDGAYFVNTARGPLVDYDALYEALQSGKLAGAALDCFGEEPVPQDSPLLALDNITITPHIGGASKETAHRAAEMVSEDVASLMAGRPLKYCFNQNELQRR
jgi:D-3-phosphoglycerate dehydrogenase